MYNNGSRWSLATKAVWFLATKAIWLSVVHSPEMTMWQPSFVFSQQIFRLRLTWKNSTKTACPLSPLFAYEGVSAATHSAAATEYSAAATEQSVKCRAELGVHAVVDEEVSRAVEDDDSVWESCQLQIDVIKCIPSHGLATSTRGCVWVT